MSYGAFYSTQPSTRTYVDTSQPLNGLGADTSDLLAIYDGVAGLGAAPSTCGCTGTRGRLAGFGNEILPSDDGTPVAASVNYMTAVTALVVAGSVAVLGYYLLGGSKGGSAMRANGRKRKRRATMRRNAAKKRASGFYVTTYCNRAHSLKTGRPIGHECYTIPVAALRAEREGNYDLANEILSQHRRMRRNGSKVPAYLLQKKGRTGPRQAHAAAHYLAETRWHGAPKKVRHWSGKHLAHHRFHTNARA